MKKNKISVKNPETGETLYFTSRKAAENWIKQEQASHNKEGFQIFNRETGDTMLFDTLEKAQEWIANYNEMLNKSQVPAVESVN